MTNDLNLYSVRLQRVVDYLAGRFRCESRRLPADMPNRIAGKYESTTLLLESSFRRGPTVMISEIKWKSLCIVERIKVGVLPLMMDVNVRLARIAGVSALADDLTFNNGVTCFHRLQA